MTASPAQRPAWSTPTQTPASDGARCTKTSSSTLFPMNCLLPRLFPFALPPRPHLRPCRPPCPPHVCKSTPKGRTAHELQRDAQLLRPHRITVQQRNPHRAPPPAALRGETPGGRPTAGGHSRYRGDPGQVRHRQELPPSPPGLPPPAGTLQAPVPLPHLGGDRGVLHPPLISLWPFPLLQKGQHVPRPQGAYPLDEQLASRASRASH